MFARFLNFQGLAAAGKLERGSSGCGGIPLIRNSRTLFSYPLSSAESDRSAFQFSKSMGRSPKKNID
jgi:hypothetical protein